MVGMNGCRQDAHIAIQVLAAGVAKEDAAIGRVEKRRCDVDIWNRYDDRWICIEYLERHFSPRLADTRGEKSPVGRIRGEKADSNIEESEHAKPDAMRGNVHSPTGEESELPLVNAKVDAVLRFIEV